MSTEPLLQKALRRIKPGRFTHRLVHRQTSALPFFQAGSGTLPPLLLDTTVYIDLLQGRLHPALKTALNAAHVWHSDVTEAELTVLAGILNPARPGTPKALAELLAAVELRPAHRTLNPDREIWVEAGLLSGLLARLQGYAPADRRRTLNDALLFCTAVKHGCTLLTRNHRDFDLLLQLDARGQALFYDRL